ncbi:MAG: suppressor of fused domain protein, partial [Planctomycetaceae bacterium]|nr:suppressor of fused domain protein [Planctomycetaceae bacterium]
MIDDERSESGSPIYRHEERETDFHVPEQSCVHLDQITSHIEKHLGEVKTVFHELISDLIHLDVLYIPPNESHPVQTLVTSGVSDLPMN